jgi:hypothetical protein
MEVRLGVLPVSVTVDRFIFGSLGNVLRVQEASQREPH